MRRKGVNHVRRTGDPEAGDVDHHRHDQRAADPVMCTPPDPADSPGKYPPISKG
jgi:hypothetical protein